MKIKVEYGGENREAYVAPRSTVAQVLANMGIAGDARVIDDENGEELDASIELHDDQQLRVKPKAQDGGRR